MWILELCVWFCKLNPTPVTLLWARYELGLQCLLCWNKIFFFNPICSVLFQDSLVLKFLGWEWAIRTSPAVSQTKHSTCDSPFQSFYSLLWESSLLNAADSKLARKSEQFPEQHLRALWDLNELVRTTLILLLFFFFYIFIFSWQSQKHFVC